MELAWREYQLKAANFFKGLGFTANVEHQIEGARGIHKLDVFVEGDISGIPFKWVVECKDWKSNIPKEKVLALSSIILDIGAEKGFLLSETGFQSGAIRVAEKTNITLSSLADLKEEIRYDSIIGRLNWRLQKSRNRLRKLKRESGDEYFPLMAKELGELGILESVLEDAMSNEYPFTYQIGLEVESLEQLVKIAEDVLERAERWELPN